MLRSLVAASLCALSLFSAPVAAASYTYDIDLDYSVYGATFGFQGGFKSFGSGGSVTGQFTIDDSLQLLSFNLTSVDPAGGSRTYSSASGDIGNYQFVAPAGGQPQAHVFSIAEVDGAVVCKFGTGYLQSLRFHMWGPFSAGDDYVFSSPNTRESYNASPFCNQFGGLQGGNLLGYRSQILLNGSQSASVVNEVPLPAGLPMLVAGVAAFGLVRRRKA